MYSVWDYRAMLDDPVRVAAYARAIAAQVRPEDVVLDLGCGIGTFCVAAARAGARRVYGVDPSPCVEYARQVVEENGVADRVVLWRGRIEQVDLPEAPTLVVGDVRGVLPFHAGAVAAWNGARPRLAPGARTIPRRDVLLAQPVRSEEIHRRARSLDDLGGASIRCLAPPLVEQEVLRTRDEVALAEPRPLFAVDYGAPLAPSTWHGEAVFEAGPDWALDGFLVGFEADLGAGIAYRSIGPGAATAYGSCLLPAPARLRPAAGARIALRARPFDAGEAIHLLWAVDAAGEEGPWQGRMLADPAPLDVLRAARPDHVPPADPDGDLDGHLLLAFSRGATVRGAADAAVAALPGLAPERALDRAIAISQKRQERAPRRYGRP